MITSSTATHTAHHQLLSVDDDIAGVSDDSFTAPSIPYEFSDGTIVHVPSKKRFRVIADYILRHSNQIDSIALREEALSGQTLERRIV
mmetsp:Transcript_15942/g.18421  ORF Transcript_15942/g.18421 Transcript_15942/m.18421 type:complete len:88 (+) Transcript_15942:16-279(+)